MMTLTTHTSVQVQAVVIAPSRELVSQIAMVGTKLFEGTGIRLQSLIGGANVRFQIENLRNDRPQILVATPGRLAELVFRLEKLRLGMVRAVVVDEIDNLLKEPYVGELETILDATPLFKRSTTSTSTTRDRSSESGRISGYSDNDNMVDSDLVEEREKLGGSNADLEDLIEGEGYEEQVNSGEEEDDAEAEAEVDTKGNSSPSLLRRLVCFASATTNDPVVQKFADRYCGVAKNSIGWIPVAVEQASKLPASITHCIVSIPRIRAIDMLKRVLNSKPTVESALIFVNDPHRVEVLCDKLLELGIVAAPLHGDASKDDRKVCSCDEFDNLYMFLIW